MDEHREEREELERDVRDDEDDAREHLRDRVRAMTGARHTMSLRAPTRRERLFRRVFGYWPESYVQARLMALALDEQEARTGRSVYGLEYER